MEILGNVSFLLLGGSIDCINQQLFSLFFCFWPCSAACGILVPRPGIKPAPPAVEEWNLNQWTAREVPPTTFCLFVFVFLRYAGLSLPWPLPLRSTGSGCAGPADTAHGPSRSAACGIFPDWDTNPCPLHRQADSQPLRHQGSPQIGTLIHQYQNLLSCLADFI